MKVYARNRFVLKTALAIVFFALGACMYAGIVPMMTCGVFRNYHCAAAPWIIETFSAVAFLTFWSIGIISLTASIARLRWLFYALLIVIPTVAYADLALEITENISHILILVHGLEKSPNQEIILTASIFLLAIFITIVCIFCTKLVYLRLLTILSVLTLISTQALSSSSGEAVLLPFRTENWAALRFFMPIIGAASLFMIAVLTIVFVRKFMVSNVYEGR